MLQYMYLNRPFRTVSIPQQAAQDGRCRCYSGSDESDIERQRFSELKLRSYDKHRRSRLNFTSFNWFKIVFNFEDFQ